MTLKPFMIAVLVAVAVAGSAAAATPTESYLAIKAKAFAALEYPANTPQPPGNDKIETDALKEMSGLITNIIGPLGVRGFPAHGASNVVSLYGAIEAGNMDGIRAVSPDGTSVLVTTVPLVQSWLKVYGGASAQQLHDSAVDIGKVLRDGGYYTEAVASEAAVHIYVDVPLRPGARGAVARGFLTMRSQDSVAPWPPDGLIVSVIRGDRIFIFYKPLKTAVTKIPLCENAWTAENERIQPLLDAAFNASDAVATQKAQALVDKADAAFLRCYRERVVTRSFFPGLLRHAQELVDRID